jgi:hypothetical protein
MFTLQTFLSYTDSSGDLIFSGADATQTSGSYRLLLNEENDEVIDSILTDLDAKLNAIGNWEDSSVYYIYITLDDMEVACQRGQGQG